MSLDRRCGGSRITHRQVIVGIAMSILIGGITALIVFMAGARAQHRLSDSLAEPVHLGSNVIVTSLSHHGASATCPRFDFACGGNVSSNSSCIKLKKRCDGQVDCPGAADELGCACAFRLPPRKFCDGYPDCFDESDESFCSYCPRGYFNCEDGKCIPRALLCDSKVDCGNFMDENFCFRLSADATLPDANSTISDPVDASTTKKSTPKSGFLLRNKKGNWYPVCANPSDTMQDALASFACVSMTANPLASSTHQLRVFPPMSYAGDYVYHYSGRFLRWGRCGTGMGLHVTCGDMRCGFNPRHLQPKRRKARIVGGETSDPGAWPWHGAVYKNGSYSCGATLVSDRWLVSAAHCFIGRKSAYYEVQLGMLRRNSFTPHQRTHRIDRVVVHRAFSVVTLENDIALLRMSDPAAFDFWVRPICLPRQRAPQPDDASGSYCTTIGWGDTGEWEDDSEELKEVHVPLTKSCKRDLRKWLCAGYTQGGRDACQGDSGGPLMCMREDGISWYIAGVISAGRGCARPGTPGMYTRVAYFLDWIQEVMADAGGNSEDIPLSNCPGWKCAAVGGGNCLSPDRVCDGHVDCYDAMDEASCSTKKRS